MNARANPVERAFAQWTPWIVWAPLAGSASALLWAWKYGFHAIYLWVTLIGYAVTMIGVEIGFHRHFAHRSFRAHAALRIALGVAGSMAMQGPLIYWLSNHLRHHAHADAEGDPHSPARGLLHAHVGWIFGVDLAESYRYMPVSCTKDRVIRWTNRAFVWIAVSGILLPAAVAAALTRDVQIAVGAALWGGFVRIVLVNQVVFAVNSLCHTFGARPNTTGDRSTNLAWLALPTLGGSYHNNHHAAPASATTSRRMTEIDPSFWLIRIWEMSGLAWDVRRPRR